jgi:hypothetical protein
MDRGRLQARARSPVARSLVGSGAPVSPRAVARRASRNIPPCRAGCTPHERARKGRAHACTQRRACAHACYRIRLGIARPGKEGEEWEKFDAAISALLERAYHELAQVVRLASLVDML